MMPICTQVQMLQMVAPLLMVVSEAVAANNASHCANPVE